jgi:hypothetical protein
MATNPNTKKLADALFPQITDEELEESVLDIPANQRRLITSTLDFSVSTIADYLDNGVIRIPEYQRRYIWTGAKPSRLIESLVIQCPIPVIYLNRAADETLEVIDGNQRFTTIRRFLANEFTLKGLTAFPELVGSDYSSLDPRIKRHIANRTLRCIIIEKETHPQIKFDVFERLNSGSMPLSAQELRNGLYHGPLMKSLEKLAKVKHFVSMTGLSRDQRMKREELILRFFAFSHDWKGYKKPLSAFLNAFAENNRKISEPDLQLLETKFTTTLEVVRQYLGEEAFRLEQTSASGRQAAKFNSAYFDAIMVGFSQGDPANLISLPASTKSAVRRAVERTSRSDLFLQFVVRATSDEKSVRARIKAIAFIIGQRASES